MNVRDVRMIERRRQVGFTLKPCEPFAIVRDVCRQRPEVPNACTMYIVKGYKVAEARARFGEMLDDAEKGVPVVIERRGVRFRILAEPATAPKASKGVFDFVDPVVADGQWTWKAGRRGLAFAPRKRR